jgi:hypothetical protein
MINRDKGKSSGQKAAEKNRMDRELSLLNAEVGINAAAHRESKGIGVDSHGGMVDLRTGKAVEVGLRRVSFFS